MSDKDTSRSELTQLIVKAQAGDSQAYMQMLERVGQLVERFMYKRLKASDLVEDLVQDVLLNIHKALHTYNSEYPVEPWVYAIARNRLNDHLRKIKKSVEIQVDADSIPEQAADAEIRALDLQALDRAMSKLSEDQRKIVTLLKFDGKSLKETATEMNMTVSAVKVAAHRGYKVIFKELEV